MCKDYLSLGREKRKMRKFVLPLIFVAVGCCFITYSFLDTFVIPKNTKKVNLDNNIDDFFNQSIPNNPPFSSKPSSNPISSNATSQITGETSTPSTSQPQLESPTYYEDKTPEEIEALFTSEVVFKEYEHYSDPDIYINITTHRDEEDTTTYYVADIRLKSLSYLRAALAHDTFGENVEERTSDICKRKKGILAINGDYYGAQEAGYVLRNGEILRNTISKSESFGNKDHPRKNPEDLAIYRDGTFEIFNEHDYPLEEIAAKGAWQVFSFGPGLIENGQIAVAENEEVETALSGGRNQRTAIGIIAPLHYVFVVNNGRLTDEKGFSLYKLATIMSDLHCYNAYNFDGGGSSTMYLDDGTGNANKLGHLVNKPTQNVYGSTGEIKQREVSDIVYIGKK